MPIETTLLEGKPVKLVKCPICGARPFRPFMRGMVQRTQHKYLGFGPRQDYCALICWKCKSIVGYESPPANAPCWREANWDRQVLWLALFIFIAMVFMIYLFSQKAG